MAERMLPPSMIQGIIDISNVEGVDYSALEAEFQNGPRVYFPEQVSKIAEKYFSGEIKGKFLIHIGGAPDYLSKQKPLWSEHEIFEIVSEKAREQEVKIENVKRVLGVIMSNAAYTNSKIHELSYRHPDMVRDISILVDARPVFNSKRSEILSYVILTHLKLDLYRHSEPELLTLYLDRSDIESLMDACQSALEKISATAKNLVSVNDFPVYIPGDKQKDT